MDIRTRIDFWLDEKHKDDRRVLKKIEKLKSKRQFASVVKDGIMIVSELREGRVDMLLKLYPWIADAIHPPAPQAPPDDDLKAEIRQLRQLLLERKELPEPPAGYPQMKPLAGPKPLQVPKVALPVFDDDDDIDTVVMKRTTDTSAGTNLFNSMMGLQQ